MCTDDGGKGERARRTTHERQGIRPNHGPSATCSSEAEAKEGCKEEVESGEMKHAVMVHGKPYEVSVHQKSKSVWEAVGNYTEMLAVPDTPNMEIRVKGRSESAALNLWIKTAQYWGN